LSARVATLHLLLISQLEGLLGRLNGFLIPGGAANLRPGHDFFDTAARVLDYALRANDAGNVFPVLGICLGFETLMVLTAGEPQVLFMSVTLFLAAARHAFNCAGICVGFVFAETLMVLTAGELARVRFLCL
jgi:gamma-glutamyl-gamma-aminobutyrate hydrolase PuuD